MTARAVNMEQIADGLPSKSAKIRALAKAGFKRGDIAKFLGCRYQFVRNVLVDEERKAGVAPTAVVPEHEKPGENPRTMKVRLDDEGRVAIPELARQALGLKAGDALIASIEDDELHLLPIPAAVRKAQAIVRQFVPADVSLVDELLEDRRREVERERADDTRGS